jgi:hypothetical protein
VIVIVVVPILLSVPAMLMFIPPSVVGVPTLFASFVEVMTSSFGLSALPPMVLNGLVKSVIGARNPALAIALIGMQPWRGGQH